MIRTSWGTALVAAACVLAARPARAQAGDLPSARESDSLFGRSRGGDASQQLDLSVESAGGYDANVGGQTVGPGGVSLGPAVDQSASFGALSASLLYSQRFEQGTFAASGASSARYYGQGADLLGLQYSGSLGLDLRVGRKTKLSLSQTAAYLPFYTYTTLPDLFAPELAPVAGAAASDLVMQQRDHMSSGTSATLTSQLTPRTTFSMMSHLDISDFVHEDTGMHSGSASAGLSFEIANGLSLVTGYGFTQTTYRDLGTGYRIRNHAINVGFSYNRPLSLSRHTTAAFSTGTTAVQDSFYHTQFYFLADARINHEIGRSWQATGAYHRGLQYIEGVNVPMFTDAFNVSLVGNVTRRVTLAGLGGYSLNVTAGGPAVSHNRMGSATARLGIALSHQAAFTVEYVFYDYGYDGLIVGAPMWPLQVSRQGLRIGIDLWAPLVRNN